MQVIHTLDSWNTGRSSMPSAPERQPWRLPPVQTSSSQRFWREPSSHLNSFSCSGSNSTSPVSVRAPRWLWSGRDFDWNRLRHSFYHQTFCFVLLPVLLQLLLGESALVKPVTKCEGGTQTDLHPVESNIVTSYEWNEWELRRKALKLVGRSVKLFNLRNISWKYTDLLVSVWNLDQCWRICKN